ncbi:MAG TPA: 4a-hydroxytetrahydrobiopterin dehydratase [Vicinamibacterales bacterium]|nr:4a-hydroxytetrahydrobiopterin dehydratase [Vicinamibacterales bacterium]
MPRSRGWIYGSRSGGLIVAPPELGIVQPGSTDHEASAALRVARAHAAPGALVALTARLATDRGMSDENAQAVLSDEEIQIVLERLPGWSVESGQLTKELLFKDFIDSLSFVNRLVPPLMPHLRFHRTQS